MTAYIAFKPSVQAPFQFVATLDGNPYTVQITWNLFGQRFYLNILDTNGALVVCQALIGSPTTYNINLVQGYFLNSVLVYRAPSGNFEIDPATPVPS